MHPLPPTTSQPRRRWFRYSLRTLLLVIVAVSVGLGWFTARMKNAQRQQAAVATIVSLSGLVVFDDQPDDLTVAPTVSPVPGWLRRLLGDDFFRTAVHVVAFNDATMEAVRELPDIRRLDFVGSPATDAGLVHVRRLSRLESLNLSDTQITDAGLEHLHGLTQLREVCLRGTSVTNEGVKRLQQALPNCRIER